MTIASIDIGSNTIILLIADYDKIGNMLIPKLNEYRIPRVSEGSSVNMMLNENSIDRLLNGLDDFNQIILTYSPDVVLVNATQAFRISKNAWKVKDQIKQRYGWDLDIISGEREAELTFKGILDKSDNDIVVIDIGGGSTEICFGNQKLIHFRQSFPLGIVSLIDQINPSIPPTKNQLNSIILEIKKTFSMLKEKIPPYQKTIAVAGTPTTLAAILLNVENYEDQLVENYVLNKELIYEFIHNVKLLTIQELKMKFGKLILGREDLILVGTVILFELMEILGLKNIIVSTKGLRYGAIWDYLTNNKIITKSAANETPTI